MHFLLTNDDGIDADGLAVLKQAVERLGSVTIVAPAVEQSSCGHSVSRGRELSVKRVRSDGLGTAYACEGTPADCVRLGLTAMDIGPVDWVFSGVNRGANLGVDVLYSGTVAAVREAALLGCRGIALSQFVRPGEDPDWDRAGLWTECVVRQLIRQEVTELVTWNVNFPVPGDLPPSIDAVALSRDPLPMEYETLGPDTPDVTRYRYCGKYPERKAGPGTDVAAALGGAIAITPLSLLGTETAGLGRTFEPPDA